MKAIERTLGLRPTRSEVVKQYYDVRQRRDLIQEDVNQTQSILQNLYDVYVMSKDECCIWRYYTLRRIVTVTVANYGRMRELRQVRIELQRRSRHTGGSSSGRAGGAMSRLKENAMAIANIQRELDQFEEITEEMSDQRTREITQQSEEATQEAVRLEEQFGADCRCLEQLAESQVWAETTCCCSRYGAYKQMIKEVFMDEALRARGPRVL